jgi:Protein of unknown function (DUF5672)
MKLHLPDVTLVAVDTICHQLAALAVKECADKAKFGAVQVHTDNPGAFQACGLDATFVAVTPFSSLDDVMTYCWYRLPVHIETSHALIVQWDSGIVSPAQWNKKFLEYDYVGAPWGWHGDAYEVGNGGFSLRSCRLMRYVAEHPQDFPLGHPEDDILCRRYRPSLECNGFRWAPHDLALQFSFERTGFSGMGRHFGYHGIFNWPRVFTIGALQERTVLMLKNRYLNQPKHLIELLHAVQLQSNVQQPR